MRRHSFHAVPAPPAPVRRGRCPRSGAKRNKHPWGASPRRARRRGIPLPPSARRPLKASLCEGGAKRRRERYATAAPWHHAKGAFRAPARGTFAPGGKSTQKRRSNLRFENPLRAFARRLSRLFYHANAVPCKFPLNVALSLLLSPLPLLL